MSKNSKQRDCPALGRGIPVPECGEQRHSGIPCAADCPHNPFSLSDGNYERSLEIERRLNYLLVEKYESETPDKAAYLAGLDAARRAGFYGENAFMSWRFFFERDAAQSTFGERWQRAGLPGLKNDERVFLRAKMRMRVALVEIHRVLPGGLAEGVDLLSANPETLLFRDNSMTRDAVRFSTLLTWIFPMPHFWRLHGSALEIPAIEALPHADVIREIAAHLGGPRDEEPPRPWLAKNIQRVADALNATQQARHAQTLASIDAKVGRAVYELQDTFERCRECLDALPEVEHDNIDAVDEQEGFASARVWLETQSQPGDLASSYVATVGNVVIGRVLLGAKQCRLEAMGAEKLARLRGLFEERMGGRARFVAGRIDDIGRREALKMPDADMSLVPPRLLENPTLLQLGTSRMGPPPRDMTPREYEQHLHDAHARVFLDTKIPGLENRTPREAAADPALRAKLVQIMKVRVREHDRRNLETGANHDINWLLAELGLTEILFEAPPRRPVPEYMAHDNKDDEENDDGNDGRDGNENEDNDSADDRVFPASAPAPESLPLAPRLTGAPLTTAEAMQRITENMRAFDTLTAAKEMVAGGATFLDSVDEITKSVFEEQTLELVLTLVTQAWFALAPRGHRVPQIDKTTIQAIFRSNLIEMEMLDARSDVDRWLEVMTSGPQPGLMNVLMSQVLMAITRGFGGNKYDISFSETKTIAALLKAVVASLDETLRRA